MPAERFYIDAPLVGTLLLQETEFHHLVHVMRVRVGEEIELVNGKGSLAQAKVASITKHNAAIEVLSATYSQIVPRYTLAIPLMRPAKLELIVEKCTELGADAFWLYPADHSEKDELSPHQFDRLNHIAISAMKQCGRLDKPPIQLFKKLDELFKEPNTYLFGDTRPDVPKISPQEKAVFISGPEKGFSPKEIQFLEKKASGVRLHRNILRAETAPIAALLLLE